MKKVFEKVKEIVVKVVAWVKEMVTRLVVVFKREK
jgi:hypothetical protein